MKFLILMVALLVPALAHAEEGGKVAISVPTSGTLVGWVSGVAAIGFAGWAAVAALKKHAATLVPQPAPNKDTPVKEDGITKSQRVQEIVAKVLQLSAVDDDADLISMDLTVNRKDRPPMKFSVDLGDDPALPSKTSASK